MSRRPGAPAPGGSAASGPDRGGVLAQERRSFGYALAGLRHAWRTQRHVRIHAGLALLALLAGASLGLAPLEWAVLFLTITLVLALELVNTVVERTVDLASPDQHPLAGAAKDVAAGAVLVSAAGSVLVALALFGPRLWRLVLG